MVPDFQVDILLVQIQSEIKRPPKNPFSEFNILQAINF